MLWWAGIYWHQKVELEFKTLMVDVANKNCVRLRVPQFSYQ